ncbi:hypothetical protein VSDG_03250 [Cytospora chrysosperma]|uniref:Uncharacterized protein n=1 Tax=Cytospora chrysosperma TaxID=252740 RepID=A0A423WB45_CYTCH|nr:hypothetical protein VSDG_03250 [Valsa sordida]
MESDNSTSEVPKSPLPVDTQSATQQSQSPEANLERTPTPDTSAVASKPSTPVPETAQQPVTVDAAAAPNEPMPSLYVEERKTDLDEAAKDTLKDTPKDIVQEITQDTIQENTKEKIKEDVEETAKESVQQDVKEHIKTPTLDDDDMNDDNLSPPPESLSGLSSGDVVMNEGPEDEIVVGSVNAKSNKATDHTAATADREGVTAMDIDAVEQEKRPKRKRAAVFNDLTEDKMNKSLIADDSDDEASLAPGVAMATRSSKVSRSTNGPANTKGVDLGYWRESKAPNGDKHLVKGFIDSRDRLRTRIQQCNRDGKVVTDQYPLNAGPGGSWVTFDKIVFDSHLVNLDQTQVKEYVKIRSLMLENETEEEPTANDTAAVQQAIKRCRDRGTQAEGTQLPLIAYGVDIPEHILNRPEKRRRIGSSTVAGAGLIAPGTPGPQLDELRGTRPTKILLGYWKKSSEPEPENKHAVFGILGNNDMFRVKIGRETRDGRTMMGNFPVGAGALWIQYDEFELEDFLKGLNRNEIKEYCRVRQYQIDHGETPEQRRENEELAVKEARRRIEMGWTKPEPREPGLSNSFNGKNNESPNADVVAKVEAPTHDTRHAQSRRLGPALAPSPARASTQPPEFRAANRSNGIEARVERTNSLARNAVARAEAVQTKNNHRETGYVVPPQPQTVNGNNGQASFNESISRLNRVWASQEAHRLRTGNEDAKIHMGIKYERKQTGPFEGKLVSQGTIISIDGEDYVEYRVLTKPTFF